MALMDVFKKKKEVAELKAPPRAEVLERAADIMAFQGLENSYMGWWKQWSGAKHGSQYGPTTSYRGPYGFDYYTLRVRSEQQSVENMYAGQVLGRLQTNIINTGLMLEAVPDRQMLNFADENYSKWCKQTQAYFKMWSNDLSVDWRKIRNLGQLQIAAFQNAILDGDCLTILRFDRQTGLPQIELVPGCLVQSYDLCTKDGNRIVQGVEFDSSNRVVAYWIVTLDEQNIPTPKRILRYGPKTGRLMAFMTYAEQMPLGKVRGTPLLSRILSALDQIADYTGFELDAAKINSMLAMFVEKNQDRPGSNPFGGITSRATSQEEAASLVNSMARVHMKGGMIIGEMAYGEKPVSFKTDRPNVNFGNFLEKVIEQMAACLEIPPEILALKFTSSYSASRQAIVEFNMYIEKARTLFSQQFNQNIYNEWLKGMVIMGRVQAPGYLEAINAKDIFTKNAWQSANWLGVIKQNVDILKEANAYEKYIDLGLITRTQAALEITGTDFNQVVEEQARENEALAKARQPLQVGDVSTQNNLSE